MLETINKTANVRVPNSADSFVSVAPLTQDAVDPWQQHDVVLLLLHSHQTAAQCSPGHAQSSWVHVGGALVVVVHVVDAVIVEVVCVVPPRMEIGNMCRLCAVSWAC